MKKSVIVILHLGYWVMYISLLLLIWSFFFLPAYYKGNQSSLFSIMPFYTTFAIIPAVISFYCFYTIIFSKFLSKKKIGKLIISGILVSIICGIIGIICMSFFQALRFGYIFDPDYNLFITLVVFIVIISFNALINGVIGLIMRGFITSYADINIKDDLNKKNYEMELALVKSQINPHFLFNTINNIDVLITKDPLKASAYLNKLSDIMRFMLYETKTEKIELSKELTYIEKYIDLQKIRTSNPNYINYSVQGETDNLMIAPMLFIPFIENALKHTENKNIENGINVNIIIEKDKIIFDCDNKYSSNNQTIIGQSGLGNELIQKRLKLLYPNKHTLEIINKENTYKVKLILLQ